MNKLTKMGETITHQYLRKLVFLQVFTGNMVNTRTEYHQLKWAALKIQTSVPTYLHRSPPEAPGALHWRRSSHVRL